MKADDAKRLEDLERENARLKKLVANENPRPEWTEYAAQAVRTLTQHQFWQVGADKYFLLLALAQLRKCVMALPEDKLPAVRDQNVLRLLRNIDEHWDEGDEGGSLAKLRQSMPDVSAGSIRYNNKHVWLGDLSLDEFWDWVEEVDRRVRERAKAAGSPIPRGDDILLG